MNKLIDLLSKATISPDKMRPSSALAMAHAASAALYRPAEWDQHSGVIMAWPSSENEAYDKESLKAAKKDISSVAEAVALFEPVTLLVEPSTVKEAEKKFKRSRDKINVVPAENYRNLDLWMRDMAPTFVFDGRNNGSLAAVDYNFNGWGNKYPTGSSISLASIISGNMQVPRVNSSLITEGGSLEVDGEGTLLITKSSILNSNRNPNMSQQQVEEELCRTLGVTKIIWLPGKKNLDVTDYHIDGLVRFVAPGKVLLSKPSDLGDDVVTRIYEESYDILENSTDAKGRRLEIVEIAEADMYNLGLDRKTLKDIESGKEDAPAFTYVNYLLVNEGVIFPQFGDRKADAAALKVIQRLYKDRDVEPVYLELLPHLGGGIHCATQEVPVRRG